MSHKKRRKIIYAIPLEYQEEYEKRITELEEAELRAKAQLHILFDISAVFSNMPNDKQLEMIDRQLLVKLERFRHLPDDEIAPSTLVDLKEVFMNWIQQYEEMWSALERRFLADCHEKLFYIADDPMTAIELCKKEDGLSFFRQPYDYEGYFALLIDCPELDGSGNPLGSILDFVTEVIQPSVKRDMIENIKTYFSAVSKLYQNTIETRYFELAEAHLVWLKQFEK